MKYFKIIKVLRSICQFDEPERIICDEAVKAAQPCRVSKS